MKKRLLLISGLLALVIVILAGVIRLVASQNPLQPGTARLASVATARAAGTNIVLNPGFEEENEAKRGMPGDWNTDRTLFNTNTFWTREEAHGGKYSIKIVQTETAQNGAWASPLIPVKGNTDYIFSFWAKCPETSQWGAMINVHFYDNDKGRQLAKKERRGNWWLQIFQAGPFNWHKFSRRHKTPKEACYVSISLSFYKSVGRVYYDDVSLVTEEKLAEEKQIRNVLKRLINLIGGKQR